jgi:hypothetical protein
MASPVVADGGDRLHIKRVYDNVMFTSSGIADKG